MDIMKPFRRIKEIKGQEYIYEVTPYRDAEKKVRQKTTYLGKNINGVPVKVRSQCQPPKRVLSYGEFIPLTNIVNQLQLDTLLKRLFPDTQTWSLLTMAMSQVIRPRALVHIQSWYEGTVLSEDHQDLPLSSQSISNFLAKIGETTVHHDFAHELIRFTHPSTTLVYDITSLSSYSQLINLLEYGYNRDNLDLPQINLALIVDPVTGIPLMYDIYPGSIVDVSTLKNTVVKMQSQGIKDCTLVMDRGFFSTVNVEGLVENGYSFIIPAPFSLKNVKQTLSSVHAIIEDPNNLRMYQDKPLFVMPVTLGVGSVTLNGYAYYDQQREQDERTTFYRQLYNAAEKVRSISLKPWMNPADVVKETARHFASYLDWKVVDKTFEVSIRKNAVSQRVNRMGLFILVFRGDFEWDECLSLYRCKDVVEKGFSMLKNDIEALPMNVRKDSTVSGYLFVCFLSLILRMRLLRMLKESGMNKKYSIEGLLTELEKIRLMILPDGTRLPTEISKKQREILSALNLCA
jgi:transposase